MNIIRSKDDSLNQISDSSNSNDKNFIKLSESQEILISIIIFFIILVSIVYIGNSIKPKINCSQFSKSYITRQRTSLRRELVFIISPISGKNSFFKAYISFRRKSISKGYIYREIKLNLIATKVFEFDQHREKEHNSMTLNCALESNQNISDKYIFYNDFFIDYRFLELDIIVPDADNATFSEFIVDTFMASNEIAHFRVYFKLLFIFIHLGYLFIISCKSTFQFESVILIILLVSVIFSNNIFFFVQLFDPSKIYYFVSAFSDAFCDSMIYFSSSVFFELALNRQNSCKRKYLNKTVTFSICFSMLYFAASFASNASNLRFEKLILFQTTNIQKNLEIIESKMGGFKLFLSLSNFAIVVGKFVKSKFDDFIVFAFFFLAILAFVGNGIFEGLLRFFTSEYSEDEKIKHSIVKLAIQNVFVMYNSFLQIVFVKSAFKQ